MILARLMKGKQWIWNPSAACAVARINKISEAIKYQNLDIAAKVLVHSN